MRKILRMVLGNVILDLAQYPTHRFSLPAMQKYKELFENARPKLTRQKIDKAVSEPRTPGKSVNNTDLPEKKSVVLSDSSAISSAGVMYKGRIFNIPRLRTTILKIL